MKCLTMFLIVVLITPALLFAQISWTEHPIAPDYNNPWSVFGVDMDGECERCGATTGTISYKYCYDCAKELNCCQMCGIER